MFETAELGRKVAKEDFETQLPSLRAQLIQTQLAIKAARLPVVVIVGGVDGAGKGEVVHHLNEWLDPRGVDTFSFWRMSEEECERPPGWRFWQTLPARGRIAVLFGAWYSDPMTRRVQGEIGEGDLDRELARIASLERMLADDGTLLIKFWFHLSKRAQRRRLRHLEDDHRRHWRHLAADWRHHKRYDRLTRVHERAIRQTDLGHAPWHLVESADARYRDLTAGRILLETIQQRLAQRTSPRTGPRPKAPDPVVRRTSVSILDQVDLTRSLPRKRFEARLGKLQGRLNGLAWEAFERKVSTVLVFEGWDAAGKGGAIRRVTEAIDARLYRVVPVAAPTADDLAHHYLWRFWRQLPRAGTVLVFDRSWYGRVLVERVEGFARPEEWMRAFGEINDFEQQLVEHGIVLAKFWIHISKDEQWRRFQKRHAIPYKNYKITAEDWRNRRKWAAYEAAVNEMVARTSTDSAPWTLVAGNDKRFARIQVLQTLCRRLRQAL
jgi:AMP-polyphosphate phosphotransferase